MKYLIMTKEFGMPVYFQEHTGPGFSVSTDPLQAKVYKTKKEAVKTANELEKALGMKCQIQRK